MSESLARVELSISPERAVVRRVRGFVESLGTLYGLPRDMVRTLELVVEEVLVNIIDYGFDDRTQAEINLAIEISPAFVVMEFNDNGRPFDPLSAPEPDLERPVEQRPIGGLGILLLEELTECQTYERRNGRNVLRVRKHRESAVTEARQRGE